MLFYLFEKNFCNCNEHQVSTTVFSIWSMGILLTIVGSWIYQKTKSNVDKEETKIRQKSIKHDTNTK